MRHVLRHGVETVSALRDLGVALGYLTTDEYRVGGGTAAVDVAWFADAANGAPLFIFEVESTPSAGLANNAMKVLSHPSEEFHKPLHFFHIVLSGAANNPRIKAARRQWGNHNYQVYRWGDATERTALVNDVLTHHRRLNLQVRPLNVATILLRHGWGGHELVSRTLESIESLGFRAPYRHDYTCLAMQDTRFVDILARHIDQHPTWEFEYDGHQVRSGYLNGPGDHYGEPLEIALRVHAGLLGDADGARDLERWAAAAPLERRVVDVLTGRSIDYDSFVVIAAPYVYACSASILADKPLTRAWFVRDLAHYLHRQQRARVHPDLRRPTLTWLAHLVASAPPTHPAPPATQPAAGGPALSGPALSGPPARGHASTAGRDTDGTESSPHEAHGRRTEQVSASSSPAFTTPSERDLELDLDEVYELSVSSAAEGGGIPGDFVMAPPSGLGRITEEDRLDWLSDDDDDRLVPLPSREELAAAGRALVTADVRSRAIRAAGEQDARLRSDDDPTLFFLSVLVDFGFMARSERLVSVLHRAALKPQPAE